MNSISKVLLVTLLTIGFTSLVSNQKLKAQDKSFSGTITFSTTLTGDIDPAAQALAPKECVIKYSGNKSKEFVDQGQFTKSVIKDGDKKAMIILLDLSIIGKKIMYKKTEDEYNKDLEKGPKFTIKYDEGETKEIAGYKCKKAEVIAKDDEGKESSTPFYYTEELGKDESNFLGIYKDVKGVLLEFELNTDNASTRYSATKVKKQKISDKEFLIPTGYEEMSLDQIKALGGQ